MPPGGPLLLERPSSCLRSERQTICYHPAEMLILSALFGILIIVAVLLDAFETVVLPRRVSRNFRLTAWFYRRTWIPYRRLAVRIQTPARREAFLGYFGPLSLIILLMLWAAGLILGFALLQYGVGKHIHIGNEPVTFWTVLYMSGETFFTLGYGDVLPELGLSRGLAVLESGMGFAFLGMVLGYLPTIYSSFSKREIEISLLDARAGSPPTAAEFLGRFGNCPNKDVLDDILRDWERWAAEVLEGHLSYPVLGLFRSQHNNQSWLGALTMILDTSSLLIMGVDETSKDQARITFAIARHAVVDLAQVFSAQYDPALPDRLPSANLELLQQTLSQRKVVLRSGPEAQKKLGDLRRLYEPYAQALAQTLAITLPPWIHQDHKKDNWQAGPWDKAIGAGSVLERLPGMDDHF